MNYDIQTIRKYGYDILVNHFEDFLRKFVVNELLLLNFSPDWKNHIPQGVIKEIIETKEEELPEDYTIDDFFEESNFPHLKNIIIYSINYDLSRQLLGDLNKDKFNEMMDELNILRRKIAHSKSTFSDYDLDIIIEYIKMICQGESAKEIIRYLDNQAYKDAKEIPLDFFEEYSIQNNLPYEEYDLDGGFIGRRKEIDTIKTRIKSDQDRIITITGAGGVGKTAIALKVAYYFLEDAEQRFEALIWFSAKTTKLTDDGIVDLDPTLKSDVQLIRDIVKIIDPKTYNIFQETKVPIESYKNLIYKIFSSQKCLLIIDNLETIIQNDILIDFIKDIPRPSQVLITSRRGLGEIERKVPIKDMLERDAIQLFNLISSKRDTPSLLRLNSEKKLELVRRVKCYPLLIKWSIGQVCKGRDIEKSFSQIHSGESEIAKFSFNDIFSILTDDEKNILYSMVVVGDKPASRLLLMHLTQMDEDHLTEAIEGLIISSFIYPVFDDTQQKIITQYSMLELTRGFIDSKLDENPKIRQQLSTKYFQLTEQYQEEEKTRSSWEQLKFSLGIKSLDEQIAFGDVKKAKIFAYNGDNSSAEIHFEKAIKNAPNLPYAFIEYSKFEFDRGHYPHQLELAKKAVEIDSNNFHAWINYGISLRMNRHFPEAITALKKAKEINPTYLLILTELGLAYQQNGNYAESEVELKAALKDVELPNYRHKARTIRILSWTYYRWADDFRSRMDYFGQINKLKEAGETLNKAFDIDAKNLKNWDIYWKIMKDLGIALSIFKNFNEGRPYLEKCLQKIKIDNKFILPQKKIIADACYYLALNAIKEQNQDEEQIKKWIAQGFANCDVDSKIYGKLKNLNVKFGNGVQTDNGDRKYGIIKWYDFWQKYGIIEIGKSTYLFLANGFQEKNPPHIMQSLDGRTISCVLEKNPKKEGSMIASEIVIENG